MVRLHSLKRTSAFFE